MEHNTEYGMSSPVLPFGGSGVVFLLVGVLFGRLISPYTEDVAQYVVEPVSLLVVVAGGTETTHSPHLVPFDEHHPRQLRKPCGLYSDRRRGSFF